MTNAVQINNVINTRLSHCLAQTIPIAACGEPNQRFIDSNTTIPICQRELLTFIRMI